MAASVAAPASGHLAWSFAVRAFRYWITQYRRTWRSSIFSSVLGPLLYLGARAWVSAHW
jgi:hypothetical protein